MIDNTVMEDIHLGFQRCRFLKLFIVDYQCVYIHIWKYALQETYFRFYYYDGNSCFIFGTYRVWWKIMLLDKSFKTKTF